MKFYHPRAVDPRGGFYHFFKEDGAVYDAVARHLVSSTRFLFTYSMAYQYFHQPEYLEGVKRGAHFLRNVHRDPTTGGYAWTLRFLEGKAKIEDATNHCYGLAFVLLACSYAHRAGLAESSEHIKELSISWNSAFGRRSTVSMRTRRPGTGKLCPHIAARMPTCMAVRH